MRRCSKRGGAQVPIIIFYHDEPGIVRTKCVSISRDPFCDPEGETMADLVAQEMFARQRKERMCRFNAARLHGHERRANAPLCQHLR